ncbi:hypothetical protein [Streptomyces sp. NBC_01431]|uniref:hypothetical protein n=1 Tax=Streptomyces sp. NBC_01431 TaxID=2903863 RepID=UPI002E37B94D|nr:hypothetical protein [Streptomyces sp. NBC_01431]
MPLPPYKQGNLMPIPARKKGDSLLTYVEETPDGIRISDTPPGTEVQMVDPTSDLCQALICRPAAAGLLRLGDGTKALDQAVDRLLTKVLAQPSSERWREAASTALLGNWCAPFLETGVLPFTALGALRAETRTVHRQLVPVWRRGTRHGRVLSLDADLSDGLSLYDLVAASVDLLSHTAGGVFEDARLNGVLRGLDPVERQVLFAYAEGKGTTWTEAAATTGASDPDAVGERVRRKTKRLALEQRRRIAQRVSNSCTHELRG